MASWIEQDHLRNVATGPHGEITSLRRVAPRVNSGDLRTYEPIIKDASVGAGDILFCELREPGGCLYAHEVKEQRSAHGEWKSSWARRQKE